MEKAHDNNRESANKSTKKPYRTPQLIEFGKVATLTANGSGPRCEGASGKAGFSEGCAH